MSAVLLHGMAPAGTPRPSGVTLHRRLSVGGAMALATECTHTGAEPQDETPLIDAAVNHHRLLAGYSRIGDVLPVRFGTAFSSKQELAAGIARMQTPLAQDMRRVAGCVEYGLAFVPQPNAPPRSNERPARGRAFLEARQAERDWRRGLEKNRADVVGTVTERLSPVARDIQKLGAADARPMAKYALLVARSETSALVEILQALAEDVSSVALAMRLTGPGPCYSFAQAGGP